MKILLVEDNAVVRRGLIELLNAEHDMEVAGEASNGLEALTLLQGGLKADIVLTDLDMPGADGFELTKVLQATQRNLPVIILSMHQSNAFFKRAMALGAKAYLLKGENLEDLFIALRTIVAGEAYKSPSLNTGFPTC